MVPQPKNKKKKERIIQAAIEVFARDGLAKGTIASIAKKADVGKGTVYEYFDNKNTLFEHIIYDFFKQMLVGYRQLAETPMPPVEKLKYFIDYTYDYLDQLTEEGQNQKMLILIEIMIFAMRDVIQGKSDVSLSQIFRDLFESLSPVLEEGIESGDFIPMDIKYFSFLLFASLDGLGLHYYLQGEYFDINKMKDCTKSFLLNGILTKGNDK